MLLGCCQVSLRFWEELTGFVKSLLGCRFTWGEMEQLSQEYFKKYPVDGCIRVPKAKFTTNNIKHNVRWIFDHQLPAALLDLYMYVSGRRAIFVRVNQKLQKSIRSLDYFTSNQWVFSNDNLLSLLEKLSSADKKVRSLFFSCFLKKISDKIRNSIHILRFEMVSIFAIEVM